MMRRILSALLLLAVALGAAPAFAASPVNIDIQRGQEKFNLGFSEFLGQDRSVTEGLISVFQSTVKDDLKFSKLFNLLEGGPIVRSGSDAAGWAALGSQSVLAGTLSSHGDSVDVAAHIYDTSGKELATIKKSSSKAAVRTAAHEVANDVVKYFTGKPGIFTSHIAFVNDSTGRKELYIADYDGKNAHRMTNDNSIVILPRVSPDGKKVVFTSYRAGNPDLYIMNVDGTGRRRLSAQSGLNVSPSWAPSSQEIAITLSHQGPPNVYLIDLQGVIKQRLTDSEGADTAPSFSPDGSQFSFTSDRDGAPHIYIVGVDGTGLRRITTASHCDSSAWSPDGQNIVYVKGEARGHFDIYSIEVLTGIERRLTWGNGDNENPAWSPDGRFVLFTSTRRGKSELFVMSADGSDQSPLVAMKGQSFTPHWSN